MKNRWLGILPLLLLVCSSAQAEQDFYGIQMKDERWARSLVTGGQVPDLQDLNEGPVLDQAVRAEASLKTGAAGLVDFRVNVFNDSNVAIPADPRLRDFYIYTTDGQKFSLIDSEEDLVPDWIQPKKQATFSPSLGNLPLRGEDVQMIVCSFDLGSTKIFLFPWSKKDAISKLANPKMSMPPPAPRAESKRQRREEPSEDMSDVLNEIRAVKKEIQELRRQPVEAPAPARDERSSREVKEMRDELQQVREALSEIKSRPEPAPQARRVEPKTSAETEELRDELQRLKSELSDLKRRRAEGGSTAAAAESSRPEPEPASEHRRTAASSGTGPLQGLWNWIGWDKPYKSNEPYKKQPAIPTAVEHVSSAPAPLAAVDSMASTVSELAEETASEMGRSGSGATTNLDHAIKNFVYKPSDGGSSSADFEPAAVPEAALEHQMAMDSHKMPLRGDARVICFDKKYNFVTMNLGLRDGMQKDAVVNISKDGRLVAKAQVRQIREAVSAAIILPQSVRGEIRPGDKISFA